MPQPENNFEYTLLNCIIKKMSQLVQVPWP